MTPIDPRELGKWYDDLAAALVLYARQFLPPDQAADVVQDVFIRLMTHRTRPDNVKGWLYRAVRNASLSWLRSWRRRRRREQARAAELPEAFESHPADLFDGRAARDLLATLPLAQREAVVLRIWAALTFQEIAEITGGSLTTSFRRYREGLAAIRKGMVSTCRNKII